MKINFVLCLAVGIAMVTDRADAAAVQQAPEIVVTANRIAQPKAQVGSTVSIISRQEIERSGATYVYDVIKTVPGVNVTRNGGPSADSRLLVRGANPGQVRILIDGVYVNDPSDAGNEFDWSHVLLNDVERIEVLRGPQSALYGSDAMGGVVNIITQQEDGASRAHGLMEVGSYRTYQQAVGFSGAWEDIRYALRAQHYRTDGFSRVAGTSEDDGARNRSLAGSIGWKALDHLKIDASGQYGRLESEYDAFAADADNQLEKNNLSGRLAATLQTLGGAWEHIMSVQGARTKRNYDEPLSVATRFSEYDGRQVSAEYQSNFKLRTRDVLTAGLVSEHQYSENSATSDVGVTTANPEQDLRTQSLYAHYLLGIAEHTSLTFGGRRDEHSAFGAQGTYRATVSRTISETSSSLHASYGTGFKAPSLFQLYDPTFGTPNLRPEESKGYDLGVSQKIWDGRLIADFTYFRQDYQDQINYDFGLNRYRNTQQVNAKGTESELRFLWTPELTLKVSHSYLLTEDESNQRTLQRRPKHTVVGGYDYAIAGTGYVGMDVRYVSRQWDSDFTADVIKPFATVDVRAGYDVTPQATLYVRLENLLDRDYQEVKNFNASGFSAYVGIKATY